jgi:putative transposase
MSENKKDALQVYDTFLKLYEARYPKACTCLQKDKDHLFAFYDYPAIHWQHIRTTNPIESTFATIRHRTRQTKGCGSRMAALTMVYKLAEGAEKSWKRLKGYELISKIVSGVKFENGNEIVEKAA